MRMAVRSITAVAVAAALFCTAARADGATWSPSASFSGFGTLAYTRTDTREAEFINPGQLGGAEQGGTLGTDSLVGAQVNAQANARWSATVQALAERNGKGNFQPQIEWAFVKAQVTPELAVRAGRIGLPLFVVSDYRHVNYANLWVRPPVDVYGQAPVSHFDGGDMLYERAFGDLTLDGQLFAGSTRQAAGGFRVHIRRQGGLNVALDFGNGVSVRAGTAFGLLTVDRADFDALVAALDGSPFSSVADQMTGQRSTFSGLGLSYDRGHWVGNAEYTARRTHNLLPDTVGWELTGGYRIGHFTPYGTLSQLRVTKTHVDNNIPVTSPPLAPQQVPAAAMLSAAVDGAIYAQDSAQRTLSVGVRWDAAKSVAIKVQADHVRVGAGPGLFELAPGQSALSRKSINVYAVSCDFVF